MKDLSILIPARNEMFLARTVEDLLEHSESDFEIIVVLDGEWANPPITQHPKVSIIYVPESVGQRAATNLAARLSKAKYVVKCDAHCSFDQGWDKKMISAFEKVGDNAIIVPVMKNLHAFDWKCYHCGWKKYQGPTPTKCESCGKTDKIRRKMVWEPRRGINSTSYSFDSEPHFQYNESYKHTPMYKNDVIIGYRLSFNKPSLSTSVISLLTDFANSHHLSSGLYHFWGGQDMTFDTMSLSSVYNSRSVGTSKVLVVGDKLKVDGIATPSVLTEVVKNGNSLSATPGQGSYEPSISDTVCELFSSELSTPSIAPIINPAKPIPTTGSIINSDTVDKLNRILGGQFVYNEKTSSFHNGSVALTPLYDKKLTQTMSLQGSFFMATRDKYWKLKLSDEAVGNWGNQGIELAGKMWLSGGRVLVNHDTWYAHMFRTQGGDFGFPYEQSGKHVSRTKRRVWDYFFNGDFKQQIYPVSWLIEKFYPVPGWDEARIKELKDREKSLKVV